MGTVYSATQVNLNRKVAIKVLFDHTIQDQDFLRGFFREAQAAAAFTHQNIVQAYDVGHTEDDIYYFAMELVDGGDVMSMIEDRGSIIYKDALPLMTGIAEGLHYGNSTRQLTHGDLKPANILISKTGEAKLADLGLARMGGEIQGESDGIMLTPMYAAPEMILDKWETGDPRADIYSFGATLYHMLAGHAPFQHKFYKEILRMQVEDQHIPLKKVKAKIPQGVSDFVDHLLEKDLNDRPQNWQEVIDALRQLQIKATAYQAISRNPKSKVYDRAAKRNTNSKKTLFAVIAAFIVIGFTGILLIKIDSQKDPLEEIKKEAYQNAKSKQEQESEAPVQEPQSQAQQVRQIAPESVPEIKKKRTLSKAEKKVLKKEKKKLNKQDNLLVEEKPKQPPVDQKALEFKKKEKKALATQLAEKAKVEALRLKLNTQLKAVSNSPRAKFFAHVKKISELTHPNPYFNNLNFHIYEACKAMQEVDDSPIYLADFDDSEFTFVEHKIYGPLQSVYSLSASATSDKLASISSYIFENDLSNDKNIAILYALTHPQKIKLDDFLDSEDKNYINFLRTLKDSTK